MIIVMTPLTFGIYLIHTNHLVYQLFGNRFMPLTNLHPLFFAIVVVGIAIGIFLGCLCIEYMRYLMFQLLHIREKCNQLEKKFRQYLERYIR